MSTLRPHYSHHEEHWAGLGSRLERLIRDGNTRKVCDIGGGANPAIASDLIARYGLDYVVVDPSREELEKAPGDIEKIASSVYDLPPEMGGFDLVISLRVAEHVTDPREFHRICRRLLVPGGIAFHHFSTLYAPAFVLNKLVPESVSNRILLKLDPDRVPEGQHAKFPAYYRWCRGPSKRQIARLESTGFVVEEYEAAFGTAYLKRFPRLQGMNDALARFFVNHPVPHLTSFAWVVLRAMDVRRAEASGTGSV